MTFTTLIVVILFIFNYYNNNWKLIEKVSAKQIIWQDESKYDGIYVDTLRDQFNEKRSLIIAATPVTKNKIINENLKNTSKIFIDEFYKEAKQQENGYQEYLKKNLKTATFTTDYVQHFDVSFISKKYIAFVFDQYNNTWGTGNEKTFSKIFYKDSGKEIFLSDFFSSDNYLNILSKLSAKELYKKYPKNTKFIEDGTIPKKDNFDSVVFTKKGLLISFDKYQVWPGSDGIVEILIPYKSISKNLSSEMRELFIDSNKDSYNKKSSLSEIKPVIVKDTKKIKTKSVDCSVAHCVALTFDDGPSIYTDWLLDILKEKNVKATFFVLGKSAKIQRDTIRRIAKEWHEIWSHSWDHKNFKKLTSKQAKIQLTNTDAIISELIGHNTPFFRPPYGSYTHEMLTNSKTPYILWNIDPEDWKEKNRTILVNRMSLASQGDIILAHDIHKTTIAAIPEVIDKLKAKGFTLVTISELFSPEKLKNHKVYYNKK